MDAERFAYTTLLLGGVIGGMIGLIIGYVAGVYTTITARRDRRYDR